MSALDALTIMVLLVWAIAHLADKQQKKGKITERERDVVFAVTTTLCAGFSFWLTTRPDTEHATVMALFGGLMALAASMGWIAVLIDVLFSKPTKWDSIEKMPRPLVFIIQKFLDRKNAK